MSDHSYISPQSPTTATAAANDVIPVQEHLQNETRIHPLQEMAVQFKLSIGAVDDPLESEADAIADKVMRMPEQNFVQRKCASCEEEEKLQRKSISSFIQRKEFSINATASDAFSNQINASKRNGKSMDSQTQSFMQSRFGADFNSVKIHTGGEAIQMNRELNAKAFTAGNDIYFNEGQYNPGSGEGKHLLAHELTHTIQQNNGTISKQVQKKIVDDDRHVTCRNTRAGAIDTLRKSEADAISLARAAALQINLQLAFHSLIPLITETPGLNRFRDILWRRFQLDYNQPNVRNTVLPILARRFELVAGWITRLNHRYVCEAAGVEPPGDCTTQLGQGNAWTATGINQTQLCDNFWNRTPGELRNTILHEWIHFGFDWLGDCEQRRNINNTKCYDMFAAELAGTATPADYDTCCVPPAAPLPALAGVL